MTLPIFLSFDRCLLYIGHISNTGRKISSISRGHHLIQQNFSWIKGGPFWKEKCPHSGRHFGFVQFFLVIPGRYPSDIPGIFILKKMNFCQCFTLLNTLRAACSQNKHCLCLRRELILGTCALFRECHTLWVLCYTVWTPHL